MFYFLAVLGIRQITKNVCLFYCTVLMKNRPGSKPLHIIQSFVEEILVLTIWMLPHFQENSKKNGIPVEFFSFFLIYVNSRRVILAPNGILSIVSFFFYYFKLCINDFIIMWYNKKEFFIVWSHNKDFLNIGSHNHEIINK